MGIAAPNFLQHEIVSQNFSGMRHHEAEDLIFARRKFDFAAPYSDESAHKINAKIASMEQRPFAFFLQAMPLRGADACQELIDTERFGDIIVGAEIERFDLGAFVVTA